MHIAVCIKEIPDPEIAPSVFRVDEAAKAVVPLPGLAAVISPFDEQAVEAALRIRETASDPGDVRITVLTLGPAPARNIVKHALALGADDAVSLVDPVFAAADSYVTACGLAAAIRRLGDIDVVLVGRQAADTDAGIVGLGLAELLGIPAVTFACEVAIENDALRAVRVLPEGRETVIAPLPAVATIAHELGKVRNPSLRETMRAAKKPTETWSAADLGVDEIPRRCVRERLYVPALDVECEFIEGDDLAALASGLTTRLREERLI